MAMRSTWKTWSEFPTQDARKFTITSSPSDWPPKLGIWYASQQLNYFGKWLTDWLAGWVGWCRVFLLDWTTGRRQCWNTSPPPRPSPWNKSPTRFKPSLEYALPTSPALPVPNKPWWCCCLCFFLPFAFVYLCLLHFVLVVIAGYQMLMDNEDFLPQLAIIVVVEQDQDLYEAILDDSDTC